MTAWFVSTASIFVNEFVFSDKTFKLKKMKKKKKKKERRMN